MRRKAPIARVRHAGIFQALDLHDQRFGRNYDAITDQTAGLSRQDPRRYEVENGLASIDQQRVSRIVSALESNHCIGVVREQIDDFALAFVAPLGPEDYD